MHEIYEIYMGISILHMLLILVVTFVDKKPNYTRQNEFKNWQKKVKWNDGYLKHRPPSMLSTHSSSARKITEAANGLFLNRLNAEAVTISERNDVWSWTETRVLRIIFDKSFPRIILNRLRNDPIKGDTNDNLIRAVTKTELEGDFYRYFDVRHEPGKDTELRVVLQPDMMHALMALPPQIDIEFSGNSIFLYFRTSGKKLDFNNSMLALLMSGQEIVKQLIPGILKVYPDQISNFKAIDNFYQQQKSLNKLTHQIENYLGLQGGYFILTGAILYLFRNVSFVDGMTLIFIIGYLIVPSYALSKVILARKSY